MTDFEIHVKVTGGWYLLSLGVIVSIVNERRLDTRVYMNDYRDFESEFGNGTCN